MRSILSFLASVSLVCSACSASTPPPVAPPPPPAPAADSAPPVVAAPPPPAPKAQVPPPPPTRVASDVARIQGGPWPGSGRHKFGGRWYEVKRQGSGWRFRLHDEIHFQGVGMKPSDMPPVRHVCTPWENAPEKVAGGLSNKPLPMGDEAGAVCADLGPTCGAIRAWLTSTHKPAPVKSGSPDTLEAIDEGGSYGRARGECD